MKYLEDYNVRWNSPSRDSSGSMPIGNGDLGANVWMEAGGDLVLLLGKGDAWSELGQLLKLGRIRVRLDPNPFRANSAFRQTLDLLNGEIVVTVAGANGGPTLRIWADAHRPTIRIELDTPTPVKAEIGLEVWRTHMLDQPVEGALPNVELATLWIKPEDYPMYAAPDVVVPDPVDRIVWYHRNLQSVWAETLRVQGIGHFIPQARDPLANLTFGGAVSGEGLERISPTVLKTVGPCRRLEMAIHALCEPADRIEDWLARLDRQVDEDGKIPIETARERHRGGWQDFWNRSWIVASGSADAATVTRGYVLQRYMNAIAGRARWPIKYNGAFFNMDGVARGKPHDADYRRWGGGHWLQNTRWIYWPMLMAGDFDLMEAYFRWFEDTRPLNTERVRTYYGHDGVVYPECMYPWGLYYNTNYGYDRAGRHVSFIENGYFRHHFTGTLEMLTQMLDLYAFTQDASLLDRRLLPMAEAVTMFFDGHYRRNGEGKMIMAQGNALETYHEVANPITEIGGLRFVLERLLGLPAATTDAALRARWERMLRELPPLPSAMDGGRRVFRAAEVLPGKPMNLEIPELYVVFPFRLAALGQADLETARATYAGRRVQAAYCWQHDDVIAAGLGLAEEAGRLVAQRFGMINPQCRFPAFWGPHHDWTPDYDHGGAGMTALQHMLLQYDGRRIWLFPSWPLDWDVRFKLHVPFQTTIEGEMCRGEVTRLTTTPASRGKDIQSEYRKTKRPR